MSRRTTADNKPPMGAMIATRLIELDKSQKWLSEAAEIQQVYLCSVIAGRVVPSLKFLRKISVPLKIDVKTLANALLSEG